MALLIILLIFLVIKIILNLFFTSDKYSEKFLDKKYNVFIEGLANSYTPHIVKYILDSIPNNNIVANKNDADIIVYHVTGDSPTKDKINIAISGEPWILDNNVDLCIGPTTNQNSKYHIYYPQMYSSLFEHKKSVDSKDYQQDTKSKFCAYMYRAHHDHRVKYFDLLSKYKKVYALGESCKNTDLPTSRHINNENETYNDIAVDLYKDYKFVIAMENKDEDGYFTEKLNNPLIANSIPIYWGNKKIFDYINKDRIIYIPDYTDEELLDKIKKIDNDEIEYKKIIDQPWYIDDSKKPENVENQLQKDIQEKMKLILGNNTILITEYFVSEDKDRHKEVLETLYENLENPNIRKIYLMAENTNDELVSLCEKFSKLETVITNKRATFKMAFELGNKFPVSTIIVSNNDIIFDSNKKTFDNIKKALAGSVVLAITRHKNKNLTEIDSSNSQDSWIFKSPIIIPKKSDFYFGLPGCDNRIAYLLNQKYNVRNYPNDIIIFHNHKIPFRTYNKKGKNDRIYGDYYIPNIENL